MSGQFSASLSLDEPPGRTSTNAHPSTAQSASARDTLGVFDTGTEAAPSASTSRRRGAELGLQVGIFLYLACIAFLGAAIIVVFFGIAFSLLRHPTGEVTDNSGAGDRHMAPVEAKPEMPLSALTLSAVPPRSASVSLTGEAPASAAPVAAFAAALPAAAAATPGSTAAMTAPAASEPGSTQLSMVETQPGQRSRPNAIVETLSVPPEPLLEPIPGQSGTHSRLKRPGNGSAEIVHGMVADAANAMTWVLDDQIVILWGIRPGSPNPSPSLIGF